MLNAIVNLVRQDYLSYISNLPLTFEEKSKKLNLLNRKRELEYLEPKVNHNIFIQKENAFSIINSRKKENIRQLNESRNVINELHSDPIICETNNFKKLLNEDSSNIKQEENNGVKIIIDNKEENLNNNSSTINNTSEKKLEFFNLGKNIKDFDTNNEIKALKNKKMVYINNDLLNNKSTSRYIKKFKKINFVIRNKTSSKFRGVSRNGNNWQVLIMKNNKKYYLGNYPTEELAARVYDVHAIKMRGVNARTNFPYNNAQIKNIFENNITLKSDKISENMEIIIEK